MARYRRELPGDLLKIVMEEAHIAHQTVFCKKHLDTVLRLVDANETSLSDREKNDMISSLAPEYHVWNNRFAITWNSFVAGDKPRVRFKMAHLDSLVYAGWLVPGSDLYVRFEQAIKLNLAISREGLTPEEVEEEYLFDKIPELSQIYDAFSNGFYQAIADNAALELSFDDTVDLAKEMSAAGMQVLIELGFISESDTDAASALIGGDMTRHGGMEDNETTVVERQLYEWARAKTQEAVDRLVAKRSQG